jgi:formiminoglutamate deiminase
VHSVRAVPAGQLPTVAGFGRNRPLHVHLSEQRAENADCLAVHGKTPTALLEDAGVLGAHTVAVHGTHLTANDIAALARTRTRVCFCPTTERDLGDGIGPARELADSGVGLCLGSDSNAVVDAFEETRALELNERLAAESRGRFSVPELMAVATGHDAIGWGEVGELVPGAGADLVTVGLGSIRTGGVDPAGAVFAVSAADIEQVMIGGRWVIRDGVHQLVENSASSLAKEIETLWQS